MAKFGTNASGILFSWRDSSSERVNTLGPLCFWQWFLCEEITTKAAFSQGGGAVITSVYKMYFINYRFIDFAEIYHEAFGIFRFFSVVNSERDLNAIY